jgi:hypothetical protein
METPNQEERITQLRRAYPQLKLRQTTDEVIQLLGPPTSEQQLFSKTKHSGPIGIAFEYMVRGQSGMPNTNDVLLSVVFDTEGRLVGAQPQNIPGLEAIGSRPGPF